VAGSSTPQNTVVHRAPGTPAAKWSIAMSARAGPVSCSSNARQALRNWPITAAALSPRPTQSPTTMPMRLSGNGNVSYQSPPTSSGRAAGS
jgi:hypothetical protein